MNQILSVNNDDNNSNSNQNYSNYNNYNRGKKIEIKAVIVFFCIVLIVFGIFIVVSGIKSIKKVSEANNDTNKTVGNVQNEKPDIAIQVVSDKERKIIVTHSKEIKTVKYSWNNGEEKEKTGNGSKNLEISNIEVPPGTNTLTVTAIDSEGNENTITREQTSNERPLIEMTKEQNAIKVKITSNLNIAYIEYHWDDKEPKKYNINAKKTENTLEVKEAGEHTLYFKAVDSEGNESTKSQKIIAAKEPEVKVTTDGQNFIIRASDEDSLSKMVINLNGNEEEVKDINASNYEKKIQALDGENRLIVTVYNKSGIVKQTKLKWTKQ